MQPLGQDKHQVSYALNDMALGHTRMVSEMIRRNNPEGLLQFSLEDAEAYTFSEKDTEQVVLTYSIAGCLSLEDYLTRHVLNDEKVRKLLQQLVKLMDSLAQFYIEPAQVNLNPENMFYSRDTNHIKVLFSPDQVESGQNTDTIQEVKKDPESVEVHTSRLIRTLIYEYVRMESPNSQFISECLKFMREPGWNLKGLGYMLKREVESAKPVARVVQSELAAEKQTEKTALKKQNFLKKETTQTQKNTGNVFSMKKERSTPVKQEKRTTKKNETSKKSLQMNKNKAAKSNKPNEQKKRMQRDQRPSKSKVQSVKTEGGLVGNLYLRIGCAAIFVLLACIVLFLKLETTEKIGSIVVIGALIGLICIKLEPLLASRNEGKVSKPAKKKKGSAQAQKNKVKRKRVDNTSSSPVFEPLQETEGVQSTDKTVVKGGAQTGFALTRQGGSMFPLQKEKLIIGRQPDVADILISDNASVGRMHAELIRIESGYAIRDLNSVNGTFVNESKVDPRQAIALTNGDTLRISDTVFRFTHTMA